MTPVEVDKGAADDHGAAVRSAEEVGQIHVASTTGFGGSRLGCDAGLVDRSRSRRRARHWIIEVAGQADGHYGLRIGDGSKDEDFGAGVAELTNEACQAGQPRRILRLETRLPIARGIATVLPPYADDDELWFVGTQSVEGLSAPLVTFLKTPRNPLDCAGDRHGHRWAASLGKGL